MNNSHIILYMLWIFLEANQNLILKITKLNEMCRKLNHKGDVRLLGFETKLLVMNTKMKLFCIKGKKKAHFTNIFLLIKIFIVKIWITYYF